MSSENQQVLRLRLVYFMRRFLFLALGMGMLLPTAANAESYWLVMSAASSTSASLEKIEMESMSQCEEQGNIFRKATHMKRNMEFVCIKGK